MSFNNDSQQFESYVPVYDTIPETWESGRQFLVEQLRKITNSLNAKEIGFFLDVELLSGKAFIPGVNNDQAFRQVIRKVVDTGALVMGANAPVAHGVTFDANFTLVQIWVSGTDSVGFTAQTISGNDVIMDANDIIITSPQAFDRSFCVIEYMQEL